MDRLVTQVRRAYARMLFEKYLHWLVVCLTATLALAAIAIALPRVAVVAGLPANWDFWWTTGSAVAGVVAAGVATWLTRGSTLDAAIEIDRRFDLRERVASSLSLSEADRETAAGSALVHDAARRVERIEVGSRFRPQLDRRAWLPFVPGLVVFCLATFVHTRQAESSGDELAKAAEQVRVKEATEVVRKAMAEKRKLAEESNLKEAQEAFRQLEEGAKELQRADKADRKQTALKLNNLAKQLEERRQKLGSSDELKKQMEQMKDFNKGPAEKAAEAIKKGDWKKAVEEIEKLQEKIASDNLSEQEKEDLSKQLQQMKEKLGEASKAHSESMEKLKQQIEEQKKKGDLAKAGELQQKLDQLAQQQPQMDQLEKLAEQLQECQNCMKQGDQQGAAQAMAGLAEQLEQMQQDMDEMEMLDEAMQQLAQAKDAMAQEGMQCEECNGAGCEMCQNQQAAGAGGQKWGVGRGEGTPPDPLDAKFRDSQVRQKPGPGAMSFGGHVNGPNRAGNTAGTVEEEMTAIQPQPADPLATERLPRSRAEHAEEYFEQLRDL